ncbi:MAG: glycosyltransferase family A protein [Gemmobacter sp.]|nr:glycosyltransferase family A protein [Gemmobacter sp.]
MDNQALTRTYGNTDLPEGTPDRPLVTFALFAYNQENYIREAVEGAFSQTYSPLEIILSDDCSSDRTFEIMEEMAREYQGPHLLKVRTASKNAGIGAHVNLVAGLSQGEIIVFAAGDDVSLPHRTVELLMAFRNTPNSHFACSDMGVVA